MRPYPILPMLLAASTLAAQPGTSPFTPDTGRVAVEGGALFYESVGRGPVVVLLHGGRMDLASWDPQVHSLSRHYRVIRYDARGHGRSTAPMGPFSMSEDLRRVLDHLGAQRASLVGLSMGSGAALNFAIEHPARVEKLVLVSSSAPPPGVPAGPGVHLGTPEGRAQLGRLPMPRMLMLGERDSPPVREIADSVRREVPAVEVVTIEGAAHLPNQDAPREFNRVLLRFLRQR